MTLGKLARLANRTGKTLALRYEPGHHIDGYAHARGDVPGVWSVVEPDTPRDGGRVRLKSYSLGLTPRKAVNRAARVIWDRHRERSRP